MDMGICQVLKLLGIFVVNECWNGLDVDKKLRHKSEQYKFGKWHIILFYILLIQIEYTILAALFLFILTFLISFIIFLAQTNDCSKNNKH